MITIRYLTLKLLKKGKSLCKAVVPWCINPNKGLIDARKSNLSCACRVNNLLRWAYWLDELVNPSKKKDEFQCKIKHCFEKKKHELKQLFIDHIIEHLQYFVFYGMDNGKETNRLGLDIKLMYLKSFNHSYFDIMKFFWVNEIDN